MPTGYTADVQSGKVTDFKQFAMKCVRGMGVCVIMRDDPHDAAIPERWEPSTWHDERLAEAVADEKRILAMSAADEEQQCLKEHEEAMAEYRRSEERRKAERSRYETMLAKVWAWNPPTPEHEGFKDFMRTQLVQSIDFDCGSGPSAPVLQTSSEWRKAKLKAIHWSIEYHTKERAEEIERTESRNRWMAEFRKSLAS